MASDSGETLHSVLEWTTDVDVRTGSLSIRVPIPLTTGRADVTPSLALRSSGGGAPSPFGDGWSLDGVPAITTAGREQTLPRYDDSDVYLADGNELTPAIDPPLVIDGHVVRRYRAVVETANVRFEQWRSIADGEVHWRARHPDGSVVIYGTRADGTSRIADPNDARRVSHWLAELRFDPRGHAIRYDYAAETADGATAVYELSRTGALAQRYLKRVRYGNTQPIAGGIEPSDTAWLFEVVLDYGEHAGDPDVAPAQAWPARLGARSSYRTGFEIRTHRLCRRILMFHHMAPLGPGATLVGATVLSHTDGAAATTLDAIHYVGHRREASGARHSRATPPLVFTYTTSAPAAAFETVPSEVEENVPAGFASRQQWIDLVGDGLPGILAEHDRVWYYKRNEGGGRFARQRALAEAPAHRVGQFAVGDFDGNGNADVVARSGRAAGYYERDREQATWTGFAPFTATAHLEGAGTHGQWLDLDGDGRPELVISHADRFVWYPSLGKDGFAPAIEIPKPQVAAPTVSENLALGLSFADMTGDGLLDLVRVQRGRVEYWPHLGHGRFGEPVVMDGGELLGIDHDFDPDRIRFVDLDGSGTSDILYLGVGEVRIYYNAGGNQLVPGPQISHLPYIDRLSSAHVLDLFGDGASHLVWSSPLAGRGHAMHYLPLTSATPPRLVARISNSMGREVHLAYASSVSHYLRDRDRGMEWKSLLPQHVTVVETVELRDLVTGSRAISRYEYHGGVYDNEQRRFRGFSHVDHFDSALVLDPDEIATPNGCTRSWFHTGTPRWEHALADAYSGDPMLPRLAGHELADPLLSDGEYEAALRAVAGNAIRTELFAVEESGVLAAHPFRIDQQRFLVQRVQPAVDGREPSFRVHAVESTSHMYEQAAGDPRVTHHVALAIDEHGLEVVGADIGYARRAGASDSVPAQNETIARVARRTLEHRDEAGRYELGIPIAVETFVVTGLPPTGSALHDRTALTTQLAGALVTPLGFHEQPTSGIQARRVEWARTLYWNAARDAVLPLGDVGPIVLIHHDETAVFTPELVATVFEGRVDDAMLEDLFYVAADGYWWAREPVRHMGGPESFFALERAVRANGATISYTYDPLLLGTHEHVDAAGNRTTFELDYHRIENRRITDPNGNVREIVYDPLGAMVRTTSHGHVRDIDDGLQPYGHDPNVGPVTATFEQVLADPVAFVGQSERATCYELDSIPPRSISVEREALVHDGTGAVALTAAVRVVIAYFDGLERPVQTKISTTPGPAIQRDAGGAVVVGPDGVAVLAESAVRWQATGHVVLDDKQRPARLFEPFFTSTAAYESDEVLQRFGSAREYAYDALGRQVREHAANGAFQRIVYAAWETRHYDANDTVDESAYRIQRELLPATSPERRALDKAMAHAQTPSIRKLDPLARDVVQIEIDEGGVERVTSVTLDHRGDALRVIDPRNLLAVQSTTTMAGATMTTTSPDAGQIWELDDALGRPRHAWTARGAHREHHYDLLDRSIAVDVTVAGTTRRIEQRTYGDAPGVVEAEARNARDRLVEVRDEAGVTRIRAYTPDGHVLGSERQLCTDYKGEPDWNASVALDAEVYKTEERHDALGRIVRRELPDGTVRRYEYQAGGGVARLTIASTDGTLAEMAIVDAVEFDARGERTRKQLGNGVVVERSYDRETYLLSGMRALKGNRALIDLAYTRDPMGHVVEVVDAVQEPDAPLPILQGASITSRCEYRYDSMYRLREATGRVHQAMLEHDRNAHHIHLNNGAALERYTQRYSYDASGNRTSLQHVGATKSWTTAMWISGTSNRSLPALDDNGNAILDPELRFDAAGNLLALPHLRAMDWNHADRLRRVVVIDRSDTGQPDDAEYYVYDAGGTRTRKVSERLVAGQLEVTEKIYLEDCEIKRVRRNGNTLLERTTSHVIDGDGRAALVHRWTVDQLARETDDIATPRFHYTINGTVGSSVLELDQAGDVIHYEEYFPFGGSAFIAGDDERTVDFKEYRYSGKERDDATGFYDYGMRYYVPWLGRWLNCDPIGPEDALNLYLFVHDDPINKFDPDGTDTENDGGVSFRRQVPNMSKRYWEALKRLPAAQQKAWMNGEGFLVPSGPNGAIVYMPRAEALKWRDEMMKRKGSLTVSENYVDVAKLNQPKQEEPKPTDGEKPAQQEIVIPIDIHPDFAVVGGAGVDNGGGAKGPQGADKKGGEPGSDAKAGDNVAGNNASNAGNPNAGANPNGTNNQANPNANGKDPNATNPNGNRDAQNGSSTDPNARGTTPGGGPRGSGNRGGNKPNQNPHPNPNQHPNQPGNGGSGSGEENGTGKKPGGQKGGTDEGIEGGVIGGTGTPADLIMPGRIAEPGEQTVIGDGEVTNKDGKEGGTGTQQPSERRRQEPLTLHQLAALAQNGPPPKNAPRGGNGGTNPPPMNGQRPDTMDHIVNWTGYTDFEFSRGSPNGESGGIPGAVGKLNLGKAGQAGYMVLAVANVITMIPKAALRRALKGITHIKDVGLLGLRAGKIQWDLLRKGAFTKGLGLRFGSPRYFANVYKAFKSTVGLTAVVDKTGALKVFITHTSPEAYKALKAGLIKLAPNEKVAGIAPKIVNDKVLKHAEQMGVEWAQKLGFERGWVGSSNLGCYNCQKWLAQFKGAWTHVNPKP